MKFGKILLTNQVPEWSRNYISYKTLKREIKDAVSQPIKEDTTTSIYFHLDRELEKVNTFFVYKQSLIDRRLWILNEKCDNAVDENDELILALKETRSQIDKLMWFAEMNSKGFRKILKKLDKKLGLDTQQEYWKNKVMVLPFATPAHLRQEQTNLNKGKMNNSTMKLSRYTSKNEGISLAIQKDDRKQLEILLKEEGKMGDTLLEMAVEYESLDCLHYLTFIGYSLINKKDVNERNLLHRACLQSSSSIKLVTTLLKIESKLALQKDFSGRRPLHYAVEMNHIEMVSLLMKHAIDNDYYTADGFADPVWQDREGFSPVFYGILHQSTMAVKQLIEIGHIYDIDGLISSGGKSPTNTISSQGSFLSTDSLLDDKLHSLSDPLPDFARSLHHPSSVALACKLVNYELLKMLIEKNASVDLADDDGETPLLFAIRSHFVEGIRLLIDRGQVDVNLSEKVNGWTPLMIAAIDGYKDIVELLLNADANKESVDINGWTASDHAVFRGHLEIGIMTRPKNPKLNLSSPKMFDIASPQGNNLKKTKPLSRASRLYGHKYLTDHHMIIITLGSNDIRNALCQKFIHLSEHFKNEDQHNRLSLSISATNATGEFPIIDLPVDQNVAFHPEPVVLFTTKVEDVTVRFDLIETFESSRQSQVLARGTSILTGDSIFSKSKGFKGPTDKASLRGHQTVPLVQSKDLDCIGTLGFEYFVVTPFIHKNMKIGDRYTYYKSVDTQVIGHRGSGMNRKGSRLQVGENTVLSFVTAASLGAEYVEFDVQLTKDLVPVIYHDWTVTETGYDIPLNSITSEQFLNLRRTGYIKDYHTGVSNYSLQRRPSIQTRKSEEVQVTRSDSNGIRKRTTRSKSFSIPNKAYNIPIDLTRTSKMGKMKGNGPETIQGPFTTLAETLRSVPKSTGFNIEVKYPMIDEAEQDELTQFQELNIYVDTILECVYDNVEEDRHIIFSSFHPEICLALNLKQPNYPVFFLTDAGTLAMADIRCNSLQGAVHFAKQADLLGIVAASEPILESPKMVGVIKEMGLLLFTYGVLNNEVENAVAQKCYGVDAVIVDSVLAIRKGLRGD
ncbi:Glycerophosphoryl diester phosphodiesterase family-domain-containing protein [Pilobolus umbonatus]|nr:Glycerophosphoryl diester phosphodiesterase family-domain-containing protein [Pilobolus umbonatus]